MHDVHLRVIGKCVVDFLFLLVLIELFRQVLRLKRYERLSIENRRFRSSRVSLTKNSCRRGRPQPTIILVTDLA